MNQNTLRLGVLPNREKDPDLNVTRMLLAILRENGAAVVLEEEIAARLGAMELASQAENLFTQCDMAIAIGGDGTMLQVARGASASGVPVLGINLGHMGFLQEVEVGEMREAMNALCRGDYRIAAGDLRELYIVVFVLMAMAIWRHRSNIGRLMHGTENKLWGNKK